MHFQVSFFLFPYNTRKIFLLIHHQILNRYQLPHLESHGKIEGIVKKQLSDILDKNFIGKIASSKGAIILFERKKDDSLQKCIDCQKLYSVTMKNNIH